jgi:general secretion pathway protein M
MKPASMKLPPGVIALRTQAAERWRALGARERLGATLAGCVLGVWIVWSIAVAPALRTLREAPARIDAVDAQLQAMQRMAMEARELKGTSRVPTAQAIDALKTATDRLGDKGRLNVLGDRVTLTVTNATSGDLRSWLGEARSGARARPVEAQLTRGPKGYAGTIILTVGGAS